MAINPAPGERYTIRRKLLTVFGASFHVYDEEAKVVAFCRQKAFKLKEDIRLFTDESQSELLLSMKARSIIDFGACYDVTLASGEVIATLRRKGLRSMFRDSWELLLPGSDAPAAKLIEDSGWLAFGRRANELIAALCPQKFHLQTPGGTTLATFRTHFNLFVYRLGIRDDQPHDQIDDLVLLATGCLIAAIEGRQSG